MNKHQIESFLRDFKLKVEHYGLFFRVREKNDATIMELGFSVNSVKGVIKELAIEDYVRGPEEDVLYKYSPIWIFGKWINNREIYIKITMGNYEESPVLISFHFSEHPLIYPFK